VRFVSDISIWWLLPWLGISIFIAHFLYSKENWIKELGSKWMLTFKSLRASGLFLLGVLFKQKYWGNSIHLRWEFQ